MESDGICEPRLNRIMSLEKELNGAQKQIRELEKKYSNESRKLKKIKSRYSALKAGEKKRQKNENKSALSVSLKIHTTLSCTHDS